MSIHRTVPPVAEGSEALRRAAAVPIQVDADDIDNQPSRIALASELAGT